MKGAIGTDRAKNEFNPEFTYLRITVPVSQWTHTRISNIPSNDFTADSSGGAFVKLLRSLAVIFSVLSSIGTTYAGCPFDASQSTRDAILFEYRGEAGDEAIGLTLQIVGQEAHGRFFSAKNEVELELLGIVSPDRTVKMHQVKGSSAELASVSGAFVEKDPQNFYRHSLGCEVIVGTWTDRAHKDQPIYLRQRFFMPGTMAKRYPFFAEGNASDEQIVAIASSFLKSIESSNKKAAAKLAHYPFRILTKNGSRRITNQEEFVKHFDSIFSSHVKTQLKDVNPRHLGPQRQGFIEFAGGVYLGPDMKIWPTGANDN